MMPNLGMVKGFVIKINNVKSNLKVLTSEKRGGFTVVPSYEWHKTIQQIFANDNCLPTSDEKLLALFEFDACGVLYHKFFVKGWRIFKAASPIIAMTLKYL
jgi:hypothetical protein